MVCEKYCEQISEYLSDRLETEDRKSYEDHIHSCESCQLQLEESRTLWQAMGSLRSEDPSPALRSRFYAMLEQEKSRIRAKEEKRFQIEKVEEWLARFWPKRPVVQFGLSFALLLIGMGMGSQIKNIRQRNGELTTLKNEMKEMREMVSMAMMNHTSSSDRIRGVTLSRQVAKPDESLLQTLLTTLNNDPNVNVRLAAVDALMFFSDKPQVRDALVSSLSQQKSPLVQISLIDLLVSIQEKRSLNALRQLIQDQNINPAVKSHAESRIQDLS